MDTNTIKKATGIFKVPHFYRDLMILIGGLGFVLNLYFFYNEKLLSFIRIEKFNNIEIDLLIILASYILGRLILILIEVVENIYYSLEYIYDNIFIFKKTIKIFWLEYKK